MKALSISHINPVVRAVAVIGSVVALVTGATFAAISNEAVLSNNLIGTRSATAELLIWDAEANEFQPEAPGFSFTELDPGGSSTPFPFYFKNTGNVDLNLTAKINALPSGLGDGSVEGDLSADDVTLKFTGACAETVSATLSELVAGVALPCGPLAAGAQGVVGEDATNAANYQVTVKIDDDVDVTETGTELGPFDLVFQGDSEAPGEEVPPATPPTESTTD